MVTGPSTPPPVSGIVISITRSSGMPLEVSTRPFIETTRSSASSEATVM